LISVGFTVNRARLADARGDKDGAATSVAALAGGAAVRAAGREKASALTSARVALSCSSNSAPSTIWLHTDKPNRSSVCVCVCERERESMCVCMQEGACV
jgi:hypothetical protein